MARPRVLVIGAGFGGLAVARRLGGEAVDVTLVDRNNFHTFLPLLYQVATAGLNAADVAHPVRGIVRRHGNVSFRKAAVAGVDWERKTADLDDGTELAWDHLVIGAGATAEFFGIPGAAEHALPLYTLADAAGLRNHILDRFEEADTDPSAIDDGALTFVVVGGGATGVEVSGALAELFAMVLRKDPTPSTSPEPASCWWRWDRTSCPRSDRRPATTPGRRSSAAGSTSAPGGRSGR
ncbi:MAG: NAD(P)/FAD-dependent oxidoreductase [Acidimicrobiales bacterium]